jgi:peptide/nickel transport system substrate-binding protein
MKKIRATALASLALIAAVASTQAATPPKTLVVAQSITDAVSFDPAEGFELTTVQSFNSIYQRLVESNPAKQTELQGALAASWKFGADGSSITFKLKPGATFASGNPVKPEDVIFSLTRAVKLKKGPAFILGELGWTADNIDGFLKKADDSSVTLSWPAKVGPGFALSILTAPIASVVDQKDAQAHEEAGDFGNAWLKTHSAGSGAYTIKSFQPNEALVLEANAKSPGGAPLLSSVILKNVADPVTRRLLVEQGDADIARDVGADQINVLKGKTGLSILSIPSAAQQYIALDTVNEANPALKNPALWEATRWLVDYDGIANKLLKGQVQVHQSILPIGFPGALLDNPYKFDPAKAKSILDKAGLKDLRIKLDIINQPPYPDIAQSLQASFAKAGVQLEIVPSVGAQFYSRIRSHAHEAALAFWIPDYFDPHSNASAFAANRNDGSKTIAWRNGWEIPELTARTEAAVQEKDAAKRNKLYAGIQREVQKKSPLVLLFQATDQVVIRNNVKGYVQGLNADQVYYAKVSKQ